jgi:hypothetical protein
MSNWPATIFRKSARRLKSAGIGRLRGLDRLESVRNRNTKRRSDRAETKPKPVTRYVVAVRRSLEITEEGSMPTPKPLRRFQPFRHESSDFACITAVVPASRAAKSASANLSDSFRADLVLVRWELTLPSSASARASLCLAFGESFFERQYPRRSPFARALHELAEGDDGEALSFAQRGEAHLTETKSARLLGPQSRALI